MFLLVSEREKSNSKEQRLGEAGQCVLYVSVLYCQKWTFQ